MVVDGIPVRRSLSVSVGCNRCASRGSFLMGCNMRAGKVGAGRVEPDPGGVDGKSTESLSSGVSPSGWSRSLHTEHSVESRRQFTSRRNMPPRASCHADGTTRSMRIAKLFEVTRRFPEGIERRRAGPSDRGGSSCRAASGAQSGGTRSEESRAGVPAGLDRPADGYLAGPGRISAGLAGVCPAR